MGSTLYKNHPSVYPLAAKSIAWFCKVCYATSCNDSKVLQDPAKVLKSPAKSCKAMPKQTCKTL